jgi:hypothetical protein
VYKEMENRNKGDEGEMGRACCSREEKGSAYRILEGKPEGTRPLGRPRSRWKNDIKMDLREIGWGGIGWTQGRD